MSESSSSISSSSSSYPPETTPPIVLATNITTNLVGAPLDARTVVPSEMELVLVDNPYVGMHIWLTTERKEIVVTYVDNTTFSVPRIGQYEYVNPTGYTRQRVTTSRSVHSGDWLLCTVNVTLTLPSAVEGMYVKISTVGSANNVIVSPAASDTIHGESTSFVLNYQNCTVELYAEDTINWVVAEVN